MSTIDIIVPCYNYGEFLSPCVESILSQRGVDLRVLIIDDASSDHTADVASDLAKRDPRVEIRHHEVNRGNIETYNEGLDWATAKYMLLISADDMLCPGALLRATRLMDAHPEVGLVFGRVVDYHSGEPLPLPRTESEEPRWRIFPGLEWLEGICEARGDGITTPDAVVRTSLQKEVGGYRKDLPHSGDIEVLIRFALRGSIGIVDADQAIYRRHENNMHNARDWHPLNFARDRANAFRIAFNNFSNGTKEECRLELTAYLAIIRELLWTACVLIDRNDALVSDAVVSVDEILDFVVKTTPRALTQREYWALRSRVVFGSRLWPLLRRALSRQPRMYANR